MRSSHRRARLAHSGIWLGKRGQANNDHQRTAIAMASTHTHCAVRTVQGKGQLPKLTLIKGEKDNGQEQCKLFSCTRLCPMVQQSVMSRWPMVKGKLPGEVVWMAVGP